MKRNPTIAENIRQLRESRGMTQLELAEASGLSNIAIAQIETGRRKTPRSSTLSALASALNCTIEDLLHGPGEAPRAEPPTPTQTQLADVVRAQAEEIDALKAELARRRAVSAEDQLILNGVHSDALVRSLCLFFSTRDPAWLEDVKRETRSGKDKTKVRQLVETIGEVVDRLERAQ